MNFFLRLTLLLTGLAISFSVTAQDSAFNNMMRSNGRIYVVVAVMLAILIGLFIYLIRLDRKISKLEKED